MTSRPFRATVEPGVALYVYLTEDRQSAERVVLANGMVVVDVNEAGQPIGVEVVLPGPAPAGDRLDELASLPEGWDGYGAATPTTTAIDVARRLVESLSVAPTVNGGVQVELRCPGLDIEIPVDAGGHVSTVVEAHVAPPEAES